MSWAERFSRFFARQKNALAIGIAPITLAFAFKMQKLEIASEVHDL